MLWFNVDLIDVNSISKALSMFSTLTRRVPVDSNTVRRYLAHFEAGKSVEVVPLSELLPAPVDGEAELLKFHKLLCSHKKLESNPVMGVKFISSSCDLVKSVRGNHNILSPLFSGSLIAETTNINAHDIKVRGVESCIAIFVSGGEIQSFCPGLELTGSRFPFFPPHATGWAADQADHVGLVLGAQVPWSDVVLQTPCVLTKDDDPVRVGKSNGIDIRQAIAQSSSFLQEIAEVGQGKPLCVVISGIHQRVPAAAGIYETIFGGFGRVKANLL